MKKFMYISLSVGARNPPAYEARREQLPALYISPSFGEKCESFASENQSKRSPAMRLNFRWGFQSNWAKASAVCCVWLPLFSNWYDIR